MGSSSAPVAHDINGPPKTSEAGSFLHAYRPAQLNEVVVCATMFGGGHGIGPKNTATSHPAPSFRGACANFPKQMLFQRSGSGGV